MWMMTIIISHHCHPHYHRHRDDHLKGTHLAPTQGSVNSNWGWHQTFLKSETSEIRLFWSQKHQRSDFSEVRHQWWHCFLTIYHASNRHQQHHRHHLHQHHHCHHCHQISLQALLQAIPRQCDQPHRSQGSRGDHLLITSKNGDLQLLVSPYCHSISMFTF